MTYQIKQAKCPECGKWSNVTEIHYGFLSTLAFDDETNGAAGCPGCGAVLLIESECDLMVKSEVI